MRKSIEHELTHADGHDEDEIIVLGTHAGVKRMGVDF